MVINTFLILSLKLVKSKSLILRGVVSLFFYPESKTGKIPKFDSFLGRKEFLVFNPESKTGDISNSHFGVCVGGGGGVGGLSFPNWLRT